MQEQQLKLLSLPCTVRLSVSSHTSHLKDAPCEETGELQSPGPLGPLRSDPRLGVQGSSPRTISTALPGAQRL